MKFKLLGILLFLGQSLIYSSCATSESEVDMAEYYEGLYNESQEELSDLKRVYTERDQEFQAKYNDLLGCYDEEVKRREELENGHKVSSLISKIKDSTEEVQYLKGRLKGATAEVAMLRKKREGSTYKRLAEFKCSIENKTETIKRLESERVERTLEVGALRREKESLRHELRKERRSHQELQQETAELKKEEKHLKGQIALLKQKLESLTCKYEEEKRTLYACKTELKRRIELLKKELKHRNVSERTLFLGTLSSLVAYTACQS